jgi:hypothetical protein
MVSSRQQNAEQEPCALSGFPSPNGSALIDSSKMLHFPPVHRRIVSSACDTTEGVFDDLQTVLATRERYKFVCNWWCQKAQDDLVKKCRDHPFLSAKDLDLVPYFWRLDFVPLHCAGGSAGEPLGLGSPATPLIEIDSPIIRSPAHPVSASASGLIAGSLR